jgi:hypothetical protein
MCSNSGLPFNKESWESGPLLRLLPKSFVAGSHKKELKDSPCLKKDIEDKNKPCMYSRTLLTKKILKC